MSPWAIASRAKALGLQVVALSDHNAALNTPALCEAVSRLGLEALYGVEARSAEEVDLLAYFDTPAEAVAFGSWVYDGLPDVPCNPELFGDQVVVDVNEEIVEFVPRLLLNGTVYPLQAIADEARGRGGLVIAAHVDRPTDSVISQLGWLPDEVVVDAVEVSRFGDEVLLGEQHPWLRKLPIVRFSDAHRPAEIGYQQTRFWVEAVSVAEFRAALAHRGGRRAEPVRQALSKEDR